MPSIRSGAAGQIFADVQGSIDARVQSFVNRLGAFDLRWIEGMPFAYLHLPQGWRATSFARAAEEAGVLVRTADQYAPAQGRAPFAVRLAIAPLTVALRTQFARQNRVKLRPR